MPFTAGAVARAIRAFLALALIFVQTASPAAESAFWTERRQSLQSRQPGGELFALAQPVLPSERPAAFPETVPAAGAPVAGAERWAKVAGPYADVREVRRAAAPKAPVVLHIQDLHDVEEAQRNIAGLIQALAKERGVTVVGLEGAAGDFKLDPIRKYVYGELLTGAADYLLNKTLIGGPEYAGLISKGALQLFGAEDLALYRDNLRALARALKSQEKVREALAPVAAALAALKTKHYPEALAEYDRNVRGARGESLTGQVEFLLAQPGADALPLPNVRRFSEATRREKTLDFARIDAARRRYLELLTKRLSQREMQDLIRLSLAQREGNSTFREFFRELDAISARHGLSLKTQPELSAYRSYVELAEDIHRDSFLNELEGLERSVENALATTPEAKELVLASRRWKLLNSLMDISLSPEEWRQYGRERSALRKLPDAIKSLGGPTVDLPADGELEPFEDFCELALKRDAALAQNLLAKAKSAGAPAMVLVAGGFHSEGIVRELTRLKASVVVLTPRVSAIPETHGNLAGFIRDPLPLEKLFAGEPVSLVGEPSLSPRPNSTPSGTLRQIAAAAIILSMGAIDVAEKRSTLQEVQLRMSALEPALVAVQDPRIQATSGGYEIQGQVPAGKPVKFSVKVGDAGAAQSPLTVPVAGRALTFSRPPSLLADILAPVNRFGLARFRAAAPVIYYLVVSVWETAVFAGLGFSADSFEWLTAGLVWSTAGFWAAHPIVRWMARDKPEGYFAALRNEFRQDVADRRVLGLSPRLAAAVIFTAIFGFTLAASGIWSVALVVTAISHAIWDLWDPLESTCRHASLSIL